jgi:hypothetical protein
VGALGVYQPNRRVPAGTQSSQQSVLAAVEGMRAAVAGAGLRTFRPHRTAAARTDGCPRPADALAATNADAECRCHRARRGVHSASGIGIRHTAFSVRRLCIHEMPMDPFMESVLASAFLECIHRARRGGAFGIQHTAYGIRHTAFSVRRLCIHEMPMDPFMESALASAFLECIHRARRGGANLTAARVATC